MLTRTIFALTPIMFVAMRVPRPAQLNSILRWTNVIAIKVQWLAYCIVLYSREM